MENNFTFHGTIDTIESTEIHKAIKNIAQDNKVVITLNHSCSNIEPQQFKGCIIGSKRVLVFHPSNSNKGFAIGGTSLRCSFVNQFIFSNG